ncbi:hypothetical protein F2P81_001568 [Scophthalmus maximus]|uniref:Uncharacterized protein n=1 Tax=Scophthalmus maximus TaxID=52904 RepID=A0A6A4TJP7_SCOMX|nr:hypothetical protein F2P81_001568 [Scophthalmus maximus]
MHATANTCTGTRPLNIHSHECGCWKKREAASVVNVLPRHTGLRDSLRIDSLTEMLTSSQDSFSHYSGSLRQRS